MTADEKWSKTLIGAMRVLLDPLPDEDEVSASYRIACLTFLSQLRDAGFERPAIIYWYPHNNLGLTWRGVFEINLEIERDMTGELMRVDVSPGEKVGKIDFFTVDLTNPDNFLKLVASWEV